MHFAWKGPNTAETNEAVDRLWRTVRPYCLFAMLLIFAVIGLLWANK